MKTEVLALLLAGGCALKGAMPIAGINYDSGVVDGNPYHTEVAFRPELTREGYIYRFRGESTDPDLEVIEPDNPDIKERSRSRRFGGGQLLEESTRYSTDDQFWQQRRLFGENGQLFRVETALYQLEENRPGQSSFGLLEQLEDIGKIDGLNHLPEFQGHLEGLARIDPRKIANVIDATEADPFGIVEPHIPMYARFYLENIDTDNPTDIASKMTVYRADFDQGLIEAVGGYGEFIDLFGKMANAYITELFFDYYEERHPQLAYRFENMLNGNNVYTKDEDIPLLPVLGVESLAKLADQGRLEEVSRDTTTYLRDRDGIATQRRDRTQSDQQDDITYVLFDTSACCDTRDENNSLSGKPYASMEGTCNFDGSVTGTVSLLNPDRTIATITDGIFNSSDYLLVEEELGIDALDIVYCDGWVK